MWDLVGQGPPQPGSARSLLPILRGQASDLGREMIIAEFWRQWDFYPQAMVHDGKRKYVFNFGGTDKYYELAKDPFELHNRIDAPAAAEIVQRMRAYLHDWLERVHSPMKEGFERTLAAKTGWVEGIRQRP